MWEKVKLGEICEIINGYAFKSSKYVETNGARVIRITNVQKGKIVDNDPKLYPFNLLDKLDNFEIKENDILMSLTGNVDRKSTRLNSSHVKISYAVFCLKKK